jgi:hypothetical protein
MNWYGRIDAYYAGCRAQAKADREAVEVQLCTWRSQLTDEHGKFIEMIFRDEALAALAAAEIKEVK